MLWKDLMVESKSIIEWIESPVTCKRLTLTVEKNKEWFMKCPMWDGDIRINITEDIFNDIRRYINQDNDIVVIEDGESKIIFTLSEKCKLH